MIGNSVYPPFADDPEIMIKSWANLLQTGCSSFLPGHGKEIFYELLEKQYYKHNMSIFNEFFFIILFFHFRISLNIIEDYS